MPKKLAASSSAWCYGPLSIAGGRWVCASETQWHGSDAEKDVLLAALQRNCCCTYDDNNQRQGDPCASHVMLLHDQLALDHLVFVRRELRQRIEREEWAAPKPSR